MIYHFVALSLSLSLSPFLKPSLSLYLRRWQRRVDVEYICLVHLWKPRWEKSETSGNNRTSELGTRAFSSFVQLVGRLTVSFNFSHFQLFYTQWRARASSFLKPLLTDNGFSVNTTKKGTHIAQKTSVNWKKFVRRTSLLWKLVLWKLLFMDVYWISNIRNINTKN